MDGALRNVNLTREGTGPGAKRHAALQVECAQTLPALDVAPTLGIAMGVAAFAATSEGELVEPLRALGKQQVRLARYQRSVSRKVRGSANHKKAAARLGALHRRIARQRTDWLRQRTDWLHQLSARLADEHAVVALEDLRIQAMSASARGTAEAPGRHVRQKAGLNHGILDAAWGEFARQLAYKVQWRGGRVILVPAAYTSRTCRICGHESADNRTMQALFSCVACGHTENANVHAAKNILAAGHAVWARERLGACEPAACGGVVRRPRGASRVGAAPTKQEPTDAVFRLVRLRPEDFLRHRLQGLHDIAPRSARANSQITDEVDRRVQPRLFA